MAGVLIRAILYYWGRLKHKLLAQ